MAQFDPWSGTTQGLAQLGETFDAISLRNRQEKLDRRQAEMDALNEPYLKARGELEQLNVVGKKREVSRLSEYDIARKNQEEALATATKPVTSDVPNPDYVPGMPGGLKSEITYAGEANTEVPAAPAVGMPTITQTQEVPLSEAEKIQQRVALALKHGQDQEISKFATVYDLSEKLATEGGRRMTSLLTALENARMKGMSSDSLKQMLPLLARQYGVHPDAVRGIDFTADGGMYGQGPNGNLFRISPDGKSLHEFKPNVDAGAQAHDTVTGDKPAPDGSKPAGGTMWQFNPATKRYDIFVGAGKQPTFMAQMPGVDTVKADAESLAEGKLNPGAWTRYNRVPAHMANLRQAVRDIYPNFDFLKADINMKSMADHNFIRAQENVNSILESGALARQYAVALNNNDIQYANQIANKFAEVTGRPAPTNWKVMAVAMAQEYNRAYSDSVVNPESRFNKELANLDVVRSTEQLLGALDTNDKLTTIRGKAVERMRQPYPWEEVQTGKKPVAPRATPTTGKKFTVDAAGNVTEVK